MEEFIPGRTENLHDYLIPTVGDMPAIKIHLIEDPEPLGPFGAKGVGEPALIATAPAILGAIRHATGVAHHAACRCCRTACGKRCANWRRADEHVRSPTANALR